MNIYEYAVLARVNCVKVVGGSLQEGGGFPTCVYSLYLILVGQLKGNSVKNVYMGSGLHEREQLQYNKNTLRY